MLSMMITALRQQQGEGKMHKRSWEHLGVWMALVVGVLGVTLPRRACAQLKVGVVDLQAVMEHSGRAKTATKQLQALHDQLQHEIQAKAERKQHQEAELQRLQTALQAHTEAVPTPAHAAEVEDYRRRVRELQRLIADTNQFIEDGTQELREKEASETQQLLIAIRKVVRELGAGQGYSLILAGSSNTLGVLAFMPAVDLTPQVMQRFDQTPADRPVATSGEAPLAKKR
jgi:Skp family chaperone for outer membrane proteins